MEIKNKTIAICGDSRCVAELVSDDRAHFSQILEDKYAYNIIPLALAGCSNTCIAFQIKKALELNVDVVIYNMTYPGRVDIVMDSFNVVVPIGLRNFVYPYDNDTGYNTEHVGHLQAPIFSTVLEGLDSKIGLVPKLTQQHVDASKSYLLNFFDYKFVEEIEKWILSYWHQQILDAGKLPVPLMHEPCIDVDFDPDLSRAMYEFTKNNPSYPRVYHTDAVTQQITAEKIHQHLQKKLTI